MDYSYVTMALQTLNHTLVYLAKFVPIQNFWSNFTQNLIGFLTEIDALKTFQGGISLNEIKI